MTGNDAAGLIGLLGSGETAAVGGRLFETLARDLPQPVRIAVLETPAGFELNSERVAGRVADFLRLRLGNYNPQVSVIPARRRGTRFSPDDSEVCRPLLDAGLIFAGPGSPTYAAAQLTGSLAWDSVRAGIGLGASAVFASAAAIAVGRFALPVYEIYKAGHDLGWQPGLDLFGPLGLSLTFVPHWNNGEGGADLDTSRCFMGEQRFGDLAAMLPADTTVIGLDEHTALLIDLERAEARVLGQGAVTLRQGARETRFADGDGFDLYRLGFSPNASLLANLPDRVVSGALEARKKAPAVTIPEEVLALAEARQEARDRRDWPRADRLRNKIEERGWQVQDTPDGPKVVPGPAAR